MIFHCLQIVDRLNSPFYNFSYLLHSSRLHFSSMFLFLKTKFDCVFDQLRFHLLIHSTVDTKSWGTIYLQKPRFAILVNYDVKAKYLETGL